MHLTIITFLIIMLTLKYIDAIRHLLQTAHYNYIHLAIELVYLYATFIITLYIIIHTKCSSSLVLSTEQMLWPSSHALKNYVSEVINNI